MASTQAILQKRLRKLSMVRRKAGWSGEPITIGLTFKQMPKSKEINQASKGFKLDLLAPSRITVLLYPSVS